MRIVMDLHLGLLQRYTAGVGKDFQDVLFEGPLVS